MTDSNTIPNNNRNSYSNIASLSSNREEGSNISPQPNEGPTQEETTSFSSSTLTITQTTTTQTNDGDILPLTLRARPNVTWEENVIDNEGLGRKSSKRCCIFHKQRDFGESSTDSSGEESDGGSNSSDGSSSSGGPSKNHSRKPIARPKTKKIPNFQRYHA